MASCQPVTPSACSSAWARSRAEGDRAFLQHPGRRPARVALDPPVGRVRGVPGDAGQLQRPAVDPGAVVIPVRQEGRPVRDHGVERGGGGQPAGERLQRPAAAGDPRVLRVGARVAADRRQVLVRALERGQVAAAELEAGEDRVDVRVLEAGHEQPTGQVDPLGAGAGQVAGGGPDGDDPVAGDRHRLAAGHRRAVRREYRPVVEEQVSLGFHRGLPRSAGAAGVRRARG
jgi:hypothetical protein